jgi:phosphocarrier protein
MAPDTLERCVRIVNPRGLHARPCHAIASTALSFQSECAVTCEGQEVNAKSILELMTLGAAHGTELRFRASGKDAGELLQALERLVAGGFGEST